MLKLQANSRNPVFNIFYNGDLGQNPHVPDKTFEVAEVDPSKKTKGGRSLQRLLASANAELPDGPLVGMTYAKNGGNNLFVTRQDRDSDEIKELFDQRTRIPITPQVKAGDELEIYVPKKEEAPLKFQGGDLR